MARVRRALAPALMLGVAALALSAARARLAAARSFDRPAPRMAAPDQRDRVLVVAPHPDDESVPCGGLIATAVGRGAQVRVVYATYGDAFRTAAQKIFSESSVPSRDYLKLAEMRHREALAALAKLGVASSQAVFLGYPDRGIDRMWLSNWRLDSPYASPYTGTSTGPYRDSFRAGRPYAGRALLDDLEAVISGFGPTLVVAPHPLEIHVDHWGTYCFTAAALYELGLLDRVDLQLYLVHPANKWLSPARRLLDPTTPPAQTDEVKTQWKTLALDEDAARRKREAINEHQTQLLIMRDFLLNFARQRELYGQVPMGQLPGLPAESLRLTKDSQWRGLPVVWMRSGKGRSEGPAPSANILSVGAARAMDKVFVRIELAQKPSPKVQYRIHLHTLAHRRVSQPRNYTLQPGRRCPGAGFRAVGRSLEVVLPETDKSVDGIMLAVDTRRGETELDHTGWTVLRSR
jgi:LmbE family N-acetylglucosaminyl deacetylase